MILLNEINKTDNIALLIRHSDRNTIPGGVFGNEVPLNNKGIQHAIEYGKSLKEFNISTIFTSPIYRCVQTAENIIKGYGKNIDVITSTVLGDPGAHILNAKKMGEYYLKHGHLKMFREFKSGKKIDGLPSFDQLTKTINDFISKNTSQLTLFISHDLLIAFYAYASGIKEYTENEWVGYLEGLTLKTN